MPDLLKLIISFHSLLLKFLNIIKNVKLNILGKYYIFWILIIIFDSFKIQFNYNYE